MNVSLAIYCADIGSIRKDNFGWAVVDGDGQRGGTVIGELVDAVVGSLAAGVKVALGFECPLWVPVPDDASGLTAGRTVDGNRPWSAGAGASALAAGLTRPLGSCARSVWACETGVRRCRARIWTGGNSQGPLRACSFGKRS